MAPSLGGLRRLLPGWIRKSYLLKFGLALVAVIGVIGAVGLYAYGQTTEELDREVNSELLTTAELEAETVRNWRSERAQITRMLSEYPVMGKDEGDAIGITLQREKRNLPDDIYRVYVVDIDSKQVVASNAPEAVDANIADDDAPWATGEIRFPKNDDFVRVSTVYEVAGIPVLAFLTPVPNHPNRTLVLTAEIGRVTDDFRKRATGSFTQVVNQDGRIVVDERRRGRVGRQYVRNGSSALVEAGLDGERGFRTEFVKDQDLRKDYVVAYAPINESNWVVVTHKPVDAAYQLRQRITGQLLAIVAVSLVGLGLIGLTLGRNTVLALNALSQRARELEQGNLDVDLETNRQDEIGTLFSSFASMRDALRDRIEELEESRRKEAEARKQLADINADLEEQRVIISVLNRLLTHNLRNGLTVIIGRSELLAERLSGDDSAEAETIRRRSELLLRRAEKSKEVESVVNTAPERLSRVDLPSVVDDAVSQYRAQFPDATITADLPDRQQVKAGDAVGFVVYNLVENALEHNDRAEPTVHVTVDPPAGSDADSVRERAADAVELRVEDDGPGIPEIELEVIEKGEETKLHHGSGMGLWVTNWLVDHMDGEIAFRDREPRGTTVTVQLQPAEE